MEEYPGVHVGWRVDKICGPIIGVLDDNNPSVNRRIVGSSLADIGQGNIARSSQPFNHKLLLIQSEGAGRQGPKNIDRASCHDFSAVMIPVDTKASALQNGCNDAVVGAQRGRVRSGASEDRLAGQAQWFGPAHNGGDELLT